jgi:hypothetical protein
MIITLSLNPEVEKSLIERAHALGVPLDAYLQELVAREAGLGQPRKAKAADFGSPGRGNSNSALN